ncbi:MAG: acyl-CoA/acyl-ACP dehydrogenase [Planctomycetaceae bacterium]|nr:acyl-CoA/acyl-ACP dehydrogenase [Planctomycetaceae bacterium]
MTIENLLKNLKEHAPDLDSEGIWPARQLSWLAEANVLRWVVPNAYDGLDVSAEELTQGYEQLAQACLATCFVLTQRNGACQRISGSNNEIMKRELLPRLARGEIFATVGISHLTTSRQHLANPAVQAELQGDEIRLNGTVPWVTGAEYADIIVTGGTCSDGTQVLVALPTSAPGVKVQSHAELMSLTASYTAPVQLNDVVLPWDHLLAGPVEGVMKQGTGGGAGSLTTSTLALGVCGRSLELIQEQADVRDDLRSVANGFSSELATLREDLYASLAGDQDQPQRSAAAIRQRSNSLVVRITQAAMAISKGAGFLRGHPAERAVREAMFFLVWSCPQPVVQGVLEELSCREGF